MSLDGALVATMYWFRLRAKPRGSGWRQPLWVAGGLGAAPRDLGGSNPEHKI